MRRRLKWRWARADELAVARRRAGEGVDRRKEQMQAQIERVLLLSRALAAAHPQVQKLKVKKAIEKGNADGAQIYAENAIRKRTEHMNYLRLASRLAPYAHELEGRRMQGTKVHGARKR
ncbi:uncharacterized protein LOC125507377 [Triticum urartu]|uniref:uncharacterized protein LOC125507377 n=1 Tax=Triticum urartu TaxID=4572 RepID=UPI00204391D3|nr:uncharacterized protein LOC125507377 [Triticum urartu]XP_048527922.1 uncharacterized protein LOC125507377 [Triticum urartu]